MAVAKTKKLINKKCIKCTSSFILRKQTKGKYCSRKCYWLDKIGKPRAGNPANWKRKPETTEKIRLALIGRKHSEETRKKMSETHKKIPHTAEWNKNVSNALKGNKIWENLSEEKKESLRALRRGKKPTNLAQLAEISRTNNSMKRSEVRAKLSGANNKWWKGGLTPLAKQIRECFESMEWRRTIFKRDDYTCQICKQRGSKLVIDHYPVAFYQIFYKNKISSLDEARGCKEFWNLNNGRVLCDSCHKKTDNYGYKAIISLNLDYQKSR